MEHIEEVLARFMKDLRQQQKEVLSFDEACNYCSLSKSKMYKHTSSRNIPHFKPEGKLIYFKKTDLDDWLLRNRQSTSEELEREAAKYSLKKRKY